jgi:putative transposase
MAHTYTDLLFHMVFSTKNRVPHIDQELKDDLHQYMGGIVKGIEGVPLIINGTEDHVHLLVVLPPKVAVSDAIRTIKANSSGWVHKKWPKRRQFAWQTGYGAFTVSQSKRASVMRYITDQEEHHKKMTFQEEFIRLLERHGIQYDSRYVWD